MIRTKPLKFSLASVLAFSDMMAWDTEYWRGVAAALALAAKEYRVDAVLANAELAAARYLLATIEDAPKWNIEGLLPRFGATGLQHHRKGGVNAPAPREPQCTSILDRSRCPHEWACDWTHHVYWCRLCGGVYPDDHPLEQRIPDDGQETS